MRARVLVLMLALVSSPKLVASSYKIYAPAPSPTLESLAKKAGVIFVGSITQRRIIGSSVVAEIRVVQTIWGPETLKGFSYSGHQKFHRAISEAKKSDNLVFLLHHAGDFPVRRLVQFSIEKCPGYLRMCPENRQLPVFRANTGEEYEDLRVLRYPRDRSVEGGASVNDDPGVTLSTAITRLKAAVENRRVQRSEVHSLLQSAQSNVASTSRSASRLVEIVLKEGISSPWIEAMTIDGCVKLLKEMPDARVKDCADAYLGFARYLRHRGRLESAVVLWEKVLPSLEGDGGEGQASQGMRDSIFAGMLDHWKLTELYVALCRAYMKQGRYECASRRLEEGLAYGLKALEVTDLTVLEMQALIARTQVRQGNPDTAEQLLRKVLGVLDEQHHHSWSQLRLETNSDLFDLLVARGDRKDAQLHAEKAVQGILNTWPKGTVRYAAEQMVKLASDRCDQASTARNLKVWGMKAIKRYELQLLKEGEDEEPSTRNERMHPSDRQNGWASWFW